VGGFEVGADFLSRAGSGSALFFFLRFAGKPRACGRNSIRGAGVLLLKIGGLDMMAFSSFSPAFLEPSALAPIRLFDGCGLGVPPGEACEL